MTTGATDTKKWPELDRMSRRLLGVLVEKAKTTPDAYPMSVNGVVTGSNQKSNRDPILNYNDDDVEEGLGKLQAIGLVTRITGGRVERWRHNLYEKWLVDKIELAILAELLLRGPQTEGELRSRASRMEPIPDLDIQPREAEAAAGTRTRPVGRRRGTPRRPRDARIPFAGRGRGRTSGTPRRNRSSNEPPRRTTSWPR